MQYLQNLLLKIKVVKCSESSNKHDLIEIIRDKQSQVLFFFIWNNGQAKAILHDVDNLLKKYENREGH